MTGPSEKPHRAASWQALNRPHLGAPTRALARLLGSWLPRTSGPGSCWAGELPLIALALGFAWNPLDPLSFCLRVSLVMAGPSRSGPAGPLATGWAARASCSWAGWLSTWGTTTRFPSFLPGRADPGDAGGEFSSLWQACTRRAETLQLYLDQRLEHLVRQYYLLRLSHDRLEQNDRPSHVHARCSVHAAGSGQRCTRPRDCCCGCWLYRQLETAVLCPVADEQLGTQALASLGAPGRSWRTTPWSQQAIETRKLCHISAGAGGASS